MTAPGKAYGMGLVSLFNGAINYPSDTIVCALLKDTYTPDQNAHQLESDLSGEETDASYSRVTLTGKSLIYDTGTKTLPVVCDNIFFPTLTTTGVKYAVFIDITSGSLICYITFGANQVLSAQNFTLVVPAAGIVSLPVE
jgi:hypothetical protein